MIRKLAFLVFLVLSVGGLSACDTAEERAQKHYEKGMELLDEGEVERALVEFRNVFKLDGYHEGARLAYAQVEEDRGDINAAFGQYLRLVEQYPENLAGQRALTRLAAELNNWEEVSRHLVVAEKLAPEDPVILSVRAGLDYRNALRDQDQAVANLAVKASETLLEDHPDLPVARRVVIADLLRREDWAGALDAIDAGIAQAPDAQILYMQRLGVLNQLGRDDAIEAQFKDMVQRFPGQNLHATLINWYVSKGRLADAEAYLRQRAGENAGDTDAQLELVKFLAEQVGRPQALAEIDQILADQDMENQDLLRSVRAGLDFDLGNQDAAIVEMEDILEGAEPSEKTDRIKIALANMLIRTGNPVGARALVEEVLEHDASQVDALKLKAGWLIEDDRTGDALVVLRQALDQSPRDAGTMTLMAQAHERAGNRDLTGEMLSVAVEASGSAPAESLRYAQFLVQEDKLLSAEDVLVAALRLDNTNLALLSALGNVYIRMEDWARGQNVIDRLEGLDTETSRTVANELTARMLAAQNRGEELQSFLGGLADGDSGLQAAASIIRLRVAQGDIAGAMSYTNELLAKDPENPALRFIQAGLLAVEGKAAEADTVLRDLLSDDPQNERIWLVLYNLHRSQGEEEIAADVLAEARTALPDSANLKWVEAGVAEQKGDIDHAIDIYEDLYAANSNSAVVANNLASLIASYREDDASLQRAYTIARRLRGTDIPQFQDTYGWIAYRMGNYDEALEYLEPAAKALAADPTVQYHLAATYAALERNAEALEQFGKVSEMVAAGGPRPPYMDAVEAEISRLSAAPDSTGDDQK